MACWLSPCQGLVWRSFMYVRTARHNLPVKAGVLYVGRLTLNVFEDLVLPIFFLANQDSYPFAATIPACMLYRQKRVWDTTGSFDAIGRVCLVDRKSKIVTCSLWLTTVQSDDGVPIRVVSGQTVTCSIYEPPAWVRSLAALLSRATGQKCTLSYLLLAKIGMEGTLCAQSYLPV